MAQLPTSNIADITINLIGAAAAVDSYGLPLIVDTEKGGTVQPTALTPAIVTCYSMADVTAAGFKTYSKAYQLAVALFGQKQRPKSCKIASVYALSSAELSAVEAADPAWYACLLTSRASADIQTVSTWVNTVATKRHFYVAETQDAAAFLPGASVLSILETAAASRTGVMVRKVNAQTVDITMSAALIASNSVTVKLNGTATSATVFAADSNTTLAAIAVKIAALFSAGVCSAAVVDGGSGTDDDRTIRLTQLNPLIPLEVTDWACASGASQNTASATISNVGAGCADAALLGVLIPQGLGQATAAGKTLQGLTTDALSQAEYNAVTGHGGNCYVTIANQDMCQKGMVSGFIAPGAHLFMDSLFVRDRLESALQAAAVPVLAPQTGKLPFNAKGINALAASQIMAAQAFVGQEMIEPFNVNTDWFIPKIEDVSPANKTARTLPGITANLKGTGAIQSMAMTVNITF